MKAVAPHPLVVERARQGIAVRMRRPSAVEGGVEAGDLRHPRIELHREADGREIVGLVQRRQRLERRQPVEHRGIDPHRPRMVRPPMHHPVADRPDGEVPERAHPAEDLARRRRQVGHLRRREAALDQHRARGVGRPELRPHAHPVDAAAETALQPVALDREDLDLRLEDPALTTRSASTSAVHQRPRRRLVGDEAAELAAAEHRGQRRDLLPAAGDRHHPAGRRQGHRERARRQPGREQPPVRGRRSARRSSPTPPAAATSSISPGSIIPEETSCACGSTVPMPTSFRLAAAAISKTSRTPRCSSRTSRSSTELAKNGTGIT